MSKPVFPIMRKDAPVLAMIRSKLQGLSAQSAGAMVTADEQAMAEEFRRGLAGRLGVPVEQISQDKTYKWVANWVSAFSDPQQWMQKGYVARLGADLINILPSKAYQPEIKGQHLGVETQQASAQTNPQETRELDRGSPNEQERRDRYSRSEISISK